MSLIRPQPTGSPETGPGGTSPHETPGQGTSSRASRLGQGMTNYLLDVLSYGRLPLPQLEPPAAKAPQGPRIIPSHRSRRDDEEPSVIEAERIVTGALYAQLGSRANTILAHPRTRTPTGGCKRAINLFLRKQDKTVDNAGSVLFGLRGIVRASFGGQ